MAARDILARMDADDGKPEGPPVWDEAFAQTLMDCTVLVNLKRTNGGGELIEELQIFGRVVAVGRVEGIGIVLEGRREGERYLFPPDTRGFHRAPPGEYFLHPTDEVCVHPDFFWSWTTRTRANA